MLSVASISISRFYHKVEVKKMIKQFSYSAVWVCLLSILVFGLVNTPVAIADSSGEVTITSPQNNSTVSGTFTLEWDLDKGNKGDHSHIYIDGKNKGVVRTTNRKISGLSPGKHTIEVRLASKGHAELGPKDSITVMVE